MKRFAVVVMYSGPFGERWQILSRHKSYSLALRGLRRRDAGGFLAIREL